jgi:hypothetical protein
MKNDAVFSRLPGPNLTYLLGQHFIFAHGFE